MWWKRKLRFSSAGGGGNIYTASAVSFNGTQLLTNLSLAAATVSSLTYVGWFKYPVPVTGSMVPWVSDPTGNFTNFFSISPTSMVNLGVGDDGSSSEYTQIDSSNSTLDNQWFCIIASIDVSVAGEPRFKIYMCSPAGDKLITTAALAHSTDSTNIVIGGHDFYFGGDTFGDSFVGTCSDQFIYTGLSLLDVNGDIPAASRRIFVTDEGKPTRPDTITNALGTPTVMFSGNAGTFGINQGTGGAFTLTGTLSNAASSPSD